MNKKYFLLFVLVIAFVYHRWFMSWPNVATDLHLLSIEEMIEQYALPSTWGTSGAVGLGEYKVPVLWNWPVGALFGYLGTLGLSFAFLIKFPSLILVFLFGAFGIYRLSRFYGSNE